MPAHTAAGKGIQNTGQVHKGAAQADIGQIGDPGLIRSREHSGCQHIGIDRKPMPRIGGLDDKAFLEMTQERLLAHDTQHSLVIDYPPQPMQGMGDTTIAVAWKLQDEVFNLIAQGHLLGIVFRLSETLIIPASTDCKELTEALDRKFWMPLMCLCDHGMPLRDPMLCSAFFSTWFSRASCPQKRSSSAMR